MRDVGHGVAVREEQAMPDLDRVLGRLARWGSPGGVLPPLGLSGGLEVPFVLRILASNRRGAVGIPLCCLVGLVVVVGRRVVRLLWPGVLQLQVAKYLVDVLEDKAELFLWRKDCVTHGWLVDVAT